MKNIEIFAFGETFETKIDVENCPPGYYCPNVLPPMGKDITASKQPNLKNYYKASNGNNGVLQIECANFPYNGPNLNAANDDTCVGCGSDAASAAARKPSWYDYNLHTRDYGSYYRYYCPGGTAFPLEVKSAAKCSGNYINGNLLLASAEKECPKIQYSGSNLKECVAPVDVCDKLIDIGQVQYPGTRNFQLNIQNNAGKHLRTL